jgi:DegV family protein with EDD domain
MKREIGILTDSTSDIPAEAMARFDIHVVPAMIVLGGLSLRDGVDISRSELYQRMATQGVIPTTASPSAGDFEAAYDGMLRQGYQRILSIHPAAKLSGIYNAAHIAAGRFPGRVEVMESGQISLGTGFQVIAAAEASAVNAPMENLQDLVKNTRQRTHLIAVIDSLTHLAHSGRVSTALAGIGNFLQIKLLITIIEGTVNRVAQVRTHARGLAALVDQVRIWGPLERLAIVHANARTMAESFVPLLQEKIEGWNRLLKEPPILVEVTPAIGVHTGPGAVGVIGISAAHGS